MVNETQDDGIDPAVTGDAEEMDVREIFTSEPEAGEEHEIHYRDAESYQVVPASGVVGGMQPGGAMKLDFVIDYLTDPHGQTMRTDDGDVLQETDPEPGRPLIRQKQIGLIVPPSNAVSIGSWMIANALQRDHSEIVQLLRDHIDEFPLDEDTPPHG